MTDAGTADLQARQRIRGFCLDLTAGRREARDILAPEFAADLRAVAANEVFAMFTRNDFAALPADVLGEVIAEYPQLGPRNGHRVENDSDTREGESATVPLDLLRPMAAPPLRANDVPDVLAQFAASQARATGFDVSILLAAGIGAACAMLSDGVRLLVSPRSGWFESARLWLAIVGGPGAGKSPGSKAALAPVFAVHREGIGAWSAANEGKDEPAPMPAVYVNDATTEALADVLRDNERGVLYSCDELEGWLGQHDAYRNGAGKDRGEWLRLYDGGPHQVNRVRRGAFFVPNWGASLLSATTPAALRKLASKLPDDGLLQRFLLVLAAPMALPDAAMLRVETRQPAEAWDAALRRLHTLPACTVRLSAEARGAFDREQAELHTLAQAYEDSHPAFASHLAERSAMLARLALAFHALEAPEIAADVAGETMAG